MFLKQALMRKIPGTEPLAFILPLTLALSITSQLGLWATWWPLHVLCCISFTSLRYSSRNYHLMAYDYSFQYLCRNYPIVDEHVREAMGDALYEQFMVRGSEYFKDFAQWGQFILYCTTWNLEFNILILQTGRINDFFLGLFTIFLEIFPMNRFSGDECGFRVKSINCNKFLFNEHECHRP